MGSNDMAATAATKAKVDELARLFAGGWRLVESRGRAGDVASTGYGLQRHIYYSPGSETQMHLSFHRDALEVSEVFCDATIMHKPIPLFNGRTVVEGFRGDDFKLAGNVEDENVILVSTSRVQATPPQTSVIRFALHDSGGRLGIDAYVNRVLVLSETWERAPSVVELAPVLPRHLQHVPTMASKRRVWVPYVEDRLVVASGGALFVLDLGVSSRGSRVVLRKHYSEFVSLHWKLRLLFDQIEDFALPRRVVRGTSRADALEARRVLLDAFIACVMRLTPLPAAFVRFVSTPTPAQRGHPGAEVPRASPPAQPPLWTHVYDTVFGGAGPPNKMGGKTVPTNGRKRRSVSFGGKLANTVAACLQARALSAQVEHTGYHGRHALYRLRISLPSNDDGRDDDVKCEAARIDADAPLVLARDATDNADSSRRTSARPPINPQISSSSSRTVETASMRFKQFAKIHQFLVKSTCSKDAAGVLTTYFDGLSRLAGPRSAWLSMRVDTEVVEARARGLSVYFRDVFRSQYNKLSAKGKLDLFDLLHIPTTEALRLISGDLAYATATQDDLDDDDDVAKPMMMILRRRDGPAAAAATAASPTSSSVVSRKTLALATFELLCRHNDLEAAKVPSAEKQRKQAGDVPRRRQLSRPSSESSLGKRTPARLHFDLAAITGLVDGVRRLSVTCCFGHEEVSIPTVEVVAGTCDWDIPERVSFDVNPWDPDDEDFFDDDDDVVQAVVGSAVPAHLQEEEEEEEVNATKARLLGAKTRSGLKDKLVLLIEATADDGESPTQCCAVATVAYPLDSKRRDVRLVAFDEEDFETGTTVRGSVSAEPANDFNCLLVYQERIDRSFVACIAAEAYDCSCHEDDVEGTDDDPSWRHVGCVATPDLGQAMTMKKNEIWTSLTLQHSNIYGDGDAVLDGWHLCEPRWLYASTIDAKKWVLYPEPHHEYRRQLWCQAAPPDQRTHIRRLWLRSVDHIPGIRAMTDMAMAPRAPTCW